MDKVETTAGRSRALAAQAAALTAAGRHDEAEACRRQALLLLEARTSALLATQLWQTDAFAEAEVQLERAIAFADDDGWRIRQAVFLPMLAQSRPQIEELRRRLRHRLQTLLDRQLAVADPVEQIGWTCFLLAYHGEHDNRQLHSLFHAVCSKAAPQLDWVATHCAQPRLPGRPRIGFVSWYFSEHTISRLFLGLIERLDGDFLDITAFAFAGADEALRRADLTGKRVVILPTDLAGAREGIAAARLDVLVYLDLGMDPFTLFLAHARLAPVQGVLWGHPDTTGIPAIDVFLSCDAMEPENSQSHYGERLVRLPGPGTWYPRPHYGEATPSPATYGLPEGGLLYLCPQTPYKFHPDFDPILRRILEANPRAHLVLTAGWAGSLMESLVRRIAGAAPELAARIHVLGAMDRQAFLGLLQLCDVVLDPPHYSGGNTSLEALALGAPVVTWPGHFMRARHTYGFYRLMGLLDCVAVDLDAYADLAIALGADQPRRLQLRQAIRERSAVLFESELTVRAMEAWLASVVGGA